VDRNQHHIRIRIQRWRSYKIFWWVTSKVSRRRTLPPESWYSVRLVLISCNAFAVCCMICVLHWSYGLTFTIVWSGKASSLHKHRKKSLHPLFSFLPYLSKLKMRIFPNYLKNGGEAHGFGCLVITHKVMPHKTLFFFLLKYVPMVPKNYSTS